jgi:MazG family protein
MTSQLEVRRHRFLTRGASGQQTQIQLGLKTQRIHQEIEIRRWQLRPRLVRFEQEIVTHKFQSNNSWFGCYIWGLPENTGAKFQRLVDIMARLRSPGGCPWDREQTFESIKPYTLEETYEVLDAIDRGDWDELRGELGDLILQAVFYAQMAAEEKRFDINDSLDAINEKLIRRHPHIFGDQSAATGDEVLKIWDQVKSQERKGKSTEEQGLLSSVPRALPALMEARQISSRAARVGFDWRNIEEVFAKLDEERAEFAEARERGTQQQIEDELGDLFFVLVNVARFVKVDPEQALRRTNAKFRQRLAHVERRLAAQGREMAGTPIEELEALWQEAKS